MKFDGEKSTRLFSLALRYGAMMLAIAVLPNAARAEEKNLDYYKQYLEKASATPAWNGPTEKAIPQKDKYVVEISCSHAVEGCRYFSGLDEQLVKSLGWRFKVIPVADMTGSDQALLTGINSGADAIVLNTIDTKVIQGGIALARSKNIPIIGAYTNSPIGKDGVDTDIKADPVTVGKYIAADALVNANGKIHALMLNFAEFSYPVQIMASAKAELEACTDCKVTFAKPINFTSATIGTTLPQQVVGALRNDPDINTIIIGIDPPSNFIIPALNAAGMKDRVKMYASIGNKGPMALMRDGNVLTGDVGASILWSAYATVDQLIRITNGQKPWDGFVPVQALNAKNLPAPGEPYTAEDAGFVEKYKELWGTK